MTLTVPPLGVRCEQLLGPKSANILRRQVLRFPLFICPVFAFNLAATQLIRGAAALGQTTDIEMVESPTTNDSKLPGVIVRPPEQLHDLPVRFRWEATRRHPYYLTFWQSALRYRSGENCAEPAEQLLLQVAHLMLGAIGAFGLPISPSTNFEELNDGSLDPAFLSGSVQPISVRALLTLIMRSMPPAELAVIGAFFMNATSSEYAVEGDDEGQSLQKLNAISHLDRIPSPSLDSFADIPLFYMHVAASQRTIVQDVESHVRRWKARLGIEEKRVHSKLLPKYLEVWDLREGWNGQQYDVQGEHSFRSIGERLRRKLSTVAAQYRAAFHMITGHECSPRLWMRIFAPLKRSEILQSAEAILSAPMRHRMQSPIRRPVPDSVVSPVSNNEESESVVESESISRDDQDTVDQWIDAEEMMRQGIEDEKIAERLECDIEMVIYFRERFEELRPKK